MVFFAAVTVVMVAVFVDTVFSVVTVFVVASMFSAVVPALFVASIFSAVVPAFLVASIFSAVVPAFLFARLPLRRWRWRLGGGGLQLVRTKGLGGGGLQVVRTKESPWLPVRRDRRRRHSGNWRWKH